ncbi:MAG: 16S rRNA processing protein RimM [Bryobacteraceae bacterium]|nr:16S rRNA processing protein RimM [Bryobacteraceae bacterium]
MPEWLVLASIRRARGIRGEVVAELQGSKPERFADGLQVTLVKSGESKPAEIEHAWVHDGSLVLKFRGTETRTEAENLRGLDVCIPFAERPPAPEGEYYFSDLVGCKVETPDGRALGEVTAWHEFGAAPLLEVHDGKRELLVPFTTVFYRMVDIPGKRIVTELPDGLEDLSQK